VDAVAFLKPGLLGYPLPGFLEARSSSSTNYLQILAVADGKAPIESLRALEAEVADPEPVSDRSSAY